MSNQSSGRRVAVRTRFVHKVLLTALGMLETARREGHKGLVHTAAASNLGQILSRLCQADGIPLVNIVRSEEQVLHLWYPRSWTD